MNARETGSEEARPALQCQSPVFLAPGRTMTGIFHCWRAAPSRPRSMDLEFAVVPSGSWESDSLRKSVHAVQAMSEGREP